MKGSDVICNQCSQDHRAMERVVRSLAEKLFYFQYFIPYLFLVSCHQSRVILFAPLDLGIHSFLVGTIFYFYCANKTRAG